MSSIRKSHICAKTQIPVACARASTRSGGRIPHVQPRGAAYAVPPSPAGSAITALSLRMANSAFGIPR
jgi:hypothetical protein